jgi:hypothetical protein
MADIMNSISIQQGSEILKTATITETFSSGSLSVYKGVSKDGGEFVTIDEPSNRIIVITTLSSGSRILIDAI